MWVAPFIPSKTSHCCPHPQCEDVKAHTRNEPKDSQTPDGHSLNQLEACESIEIAS